MQLVLSLASNVRLVSHLSRSCVNSRINELARSSLSGKPCRAAKEGPEWWLSGIPARVLGLPTCGCLENIARHLFRRISWPESSHKLYLSLSTVLHSFVMTHAASLSVACYERVKPWLLGDGPSLSTTRVHSCRALQDCRPNHRCCHTVSHVTGA